MSHPCRIALLVPQLSDTISSEILKGVLKRSDELHYKLDIISGGAINSSDSYLYNKILAERHYDGLIVLTGAFNFQAELEDVEKFVGELGDYPLINVLVKISGYPSLIADNIFPMEELTEHLIVEHHCKKIMFIKGPENQPEAEDRFKGYRNSMEKFDLEIDEDYIFPGNFNPQMGSEAISSLFEKGLKLPDAIMCADDDTALGVYTECKKRGVTLGNEGVLITGYDNMGYTLTMEPSLTTVDQSFQLQGVEAVNKLFAIMNGSTYIETKSHSRILYRESCGCSGIKNQIGEGINIVDFISGSMDDLRISGLEEHIDRIAGMLNRFVVDREYSFIKDFEDIIYMYRYKGYNLKVLIEILKLLSNRIMTKLDREAILSYYSQSEYIQHLIIDLISNEKVKEYKTQTEQNAELDTMLIQLASVMNEDEFDDVLNSNFYYLGIKKLYIKMGDLEKGFLKDDSLNRSRSHYTSLFLPLERDGELGYCRYQLMPESFHIAAVINAQITRSLYLIKLIKSLNDKVYSIESSYNDLRMTRDSIVENEQLANIGGLVAGFTHEIGTPIGVSVTASSHMEDIFKDFKDKLDSGTLKKSNMDDFVKESINNLEIISMNLRRTASLINGFKQISVDQASDVKREIELTSYLDEIAHSLTPILRRKRHKVEVISKEKMLLYTYPGVISQVFTNLIQNSVKHGFEFLEDGHITITVIREGDEIIITYNDNGIGIDPDVRDKIFETWYSTKIGKGGSGLGLSIIKRLIEDKLLGSIICTGNKEDGAKFVITLKKLFDRSPG